MMLDHLAGLFDLGGLLEMIEKLVEKLAESRQANG